MVHSLRTVMELFYISCGPQRAILTVTLKQTESTRCGSASVASQSPAGVHGPRECSFVPLGGCEPKTFVSTPLSSKLPSP